MEFKFVTTNDKVVVEVDKKDNKVGGLIVIEDAFDELDTATVLAVGPGKRNKKSQSIPLLVTVGDRVTFTKGVGEKVKIYGKDYLILKEHEIIGIVEE
jgi:chaperonin GroES